MVRNPDRQFQQMMESHLINPIAKMKLFELLNMLLNANNHKLIDHKFSIVAYEDAIIKNETLQAQDKKIILSISSLSRYMFLMESDRKDRDWEKSKTARKVNNRLENRQVTMVNFIVACNNLMLSI